MAARRLVIGISGASGALLAVRLLRRLNERGGVETHLVTTRAAESILKMEAGYTVEELAALATRYYRPDDLGAPISSGTFRTEGMIIVPCSMKTLAGIAGGYSDNLLLRAADVTLKEGRRLVLVPRESPLHTIHLENMLKLARMGVIMLLPLPAFYQQPKTVDEVVDHIVARALRFFGINCPLEEWEGLPEQRESL